MSVEEALNFIPAYVLVFFRVAGLMISAPLFGSARIPRQVKIMMAAVIAIGMFQSAAPKINIPLSPWMLATGIGGELIFGIAMGMVMALVFAAAQWGGEMIGQQMGLNLSEIFNPQTGQHS